MGGYEYANARLRAMKARLLDTAAYRELVAFRSSDELLRALARTDYREAIEATPVLTSELHALNVALSHHLRHRFQNVRGFFDRAECQRVALVLQIYDVHNIKALLRGLENNASPDEIRDAQLPIGDLSAPVLHLLAQSSNRYEALDFMATMRLPIAHPLTVVRSQQPNGSVARYELALDRWYFEMALATASRFGRGAGLLREALAIEADLVNILAVLRIGVLADFVTREGGVMRDVLVGPGFVSFDLLEACAKEDSVEAVVQCLAATRYGEALEAGITGFRGHLSAIERSLRRYRLGVFARFMRQDPLGIGVFLGYMALKTAEVGNLRWIAHGVELGLPGQTMLEALERVA